ncbi:MBL fold metallo-hydrolase [Dongshaea marina]|nr:MBL fold metallo-hydrolase [Dongshaea marina]
MTKVYDPIMREEDYVVHQLESIGLTPWDIDYVVCSHLHLDHAGG